MAGYSETALIKKLGIKAGMKVMPINAPEDYMIILGEDISDQLERDIAKADLIHLFATTKDELERKFLQIIGSKKEELIIWVSWHKKSSGMQTDVTENIIREIVLPKGWVDIKVCAVSDVWSGLKIVKRKSGAK